MSSDNPYPPPPPDKLVIMLRMQAWRDEIDDDSRILHEQSADLLEQLMARLVRQAKVLEELEAARS